jgi:hypothetical protein
MANITYNNKDANAAVGTPERTWRDVDANEVKTAVNSKLDSSATSSFLTSADTGSFLTGADTGSFILFSQTGSFAITGSNTFTGTQRISNNDLIVTGSIFTNEINSVTIGLGGGNETTNLNINGGLNSNTTGIYNLAISKNALAANTIGVRNIAIGNEALFSLTDASDNISIGHFANDTVTSGTHNIIIGNNSDVTSGTDTSNIIIGHGATVNGDNQIVFGSVDWPVGTITTESETSDATWLVTINGTEYKILIKKTA